ncbi:hypothetical protein S83_059721, partial [Arachis hypogaea]
VLLNQWFGKPWCLPKRGLGVYNANKFAKLVRRREFMASTTEGTTGALTCPTCGCHRNFHRRKELAAPSSFVLWPTAYSIEKPKSKVLASRDSAYARMYTIPQNSALILNWHPAKVVKTLDATIKIISARYYLKGQPSARDIVGHGSHTTSIATGNKVVGASFYGITKGVARGGVPSARIAAYSVCYEQECKVDAILAAFDDAIADGVDLITISMGADEQMTFDEDITAIGSFHAMEKGILTINSVGNNGLNIVTFSVSPWLFTVAATTFHDVLLGNG